jgi:predicted enzyme related to lactoylglutathione lyase
MKRVTGIGGIFFKTKDPKALKEWYIKHLGFNQSEHGVIQFAWRDVDKPEQKGTTVWQAFKDSTTYFQPSDKDFMINLRVENLEELMEELKNAGVQTVGEMEKYDFGKFAWIIDPEGNKIELWEPIDEEPKKE